MKVLVAVARKMLIAVWHMLHDNTIYIDFTTDRKNIPNKGMNTIYRPSAGYYLCDGNTSFAN